MCEHKWVSESDLDGCGLCQGEYGPADGVLIFRHVEKPKPGDACLTCFQLYGRPEGTFHPGLSNFNKVQEGFSQK
ncbi:MAG: hypothetical protein UX46_C0014G0002 [Candidatus Amesbacteria bacterium GW2011_GWC1_46_24]|nr:MAG: hypothetical protein UX46_C0014G0002 [Candidatus Amesbacteria bacterium GW2011_GWC1_46_24]